MEKNELQELNKLLKEISDIIDKYNAHNSDYVVNLIKQGRSVKLITENRVDVSKLFVCVYNGDSVGLFKKLEWIESTFFSGVKCSGEVYVGVNSDYVGIKANLEKRNYVDKWYPPGVEVFTYSDKNYHISNCYMSYAISFDNLRMLMHSEGYLDKYLIGKATNQEMLDVLDYAFQHFTVLNKTKPHAKNR